MPLENFDFALTTDGAAAANYPVRVDLPPAVSTRTGSTAVNSTPAPEPATPDAFEDAFAAALPIPARAAAAPPARPSLVAVDFDIATFGRVPSSGGGVRDSKPLIIDGTAVGMVDLTLGQGSVVSVDRRRLAALIAGRQPTLTETLDRLDGELVTLDALRTGGVRVRYDPLADALVIDNAS